MRISDWSSDVCSSDLRSFSRAARTFRRRLHSQRRARRPAHRTARRVRPTLPAHLAGVHAGAVRRGADRLPPAVARSEEHTSELQSLLRISYAVFCLQQKTGTPLAANTTTPTTPRR